MNNINQSLSMYTNQTTGNNKTPKELPGIHGHNRSGSTRHQTEEGPGGSSTGNELAGGAYNYKKRNVSGNNRNLITMNNQQIGAQYIHGSGNNLTPSKGGKANNVVL